MTKLAPEWVRTSDPVIRSPARYRWTTAPATTNNGPHRIIQEDTLYRFPQLSQPAPIVGQSYHTRGYTLPFPSIIPPAPIVGQSYHTRGYTLPFPSIIPPAPIVGQS